MLQQPQQHIEQSYIFQNQIFKYTKDFLKTTQKLFEMETS